jgi:hypothetical protein
MIMIEHDRIYQNKWTKQKSYYIIFTLVPLGKRHTASKFQNCTNAHIRKAVYGWYLVVMGGVTTPVSHPTEPKPSR